MTKVFGVGLSKTGTVSLTVALNRLGYSCEHYPPFERVLEHAERFDALTDITVIPYMAALDALYPDAKWILTVRDIDAWLTSCTMHFAKPPRPELRGARLAVYGAEVFDRRVWREAYYQHELTMLQRFRKRPGQLLALSICGGEGWGRLCPFLGLPVRDEPFPHKNKRGAVT